MKSEYNNLVRTNNSQLTQTKIFSSKFLLPGKTSFLPKNKSNVNNLKTIKIAGMEWN